MAYCGQATIVPVQRLDKREDAAELKKAMDCGTEQDTILTILTDRTNAQRQEIIKEYKTSYGQDLVQQLRRRLRGNFEDAVVALLDPPPVFDARCLKKAMKGFGTNLSALLEILCARTNDQIRAMKAAYKEAYNVDLESDLQSETSGDLKRLLIGLVQGRRDESGNVDSMEAKRDAQALYEAGELKWGTDESEFQRILLTRNWRQMNEIFDAYSKIAGRSIEDSIEREMSGDLRRGFLNIIQYARCPGEYFADVLNMAMEGWGTDEERLTRTLVSRSEIDLGDVKRAYQTKYRRSLARAVESEVSGYYRKLLLRLIK